MLVVLLLVFASCCISLSVSGVWALFRTSRFAFLLRVAAFCWKKRVWAYAFSKQRLRILHRTSALDPLFRRPSGESLFFFVFAFQNVRVSVREHHTRTAYSFSGFLRLAVFFEADIARGDFGAEKVKIQIPVGNANFPLFQLLLRHRNPSTFSLQCVFWEAFLRTNNQPKKQRNKQTNKRTNKRTNKQTNKQTNQQTNKQTNEPTNKQTNKQTTRETNTQTKQHTNKHTNKPKERTHAYSKRF